MMGELWKCNQPIGLVVAVTMMMMNVTIEVDREHMQTPVS